MKETNDYIKSILVIILILGVAFMEGVMLERHIQPYEAITKDHGDIPHYMIEVVAWDYIGELKPNQIRGTR